MENIPIVQIVGVMAAMASTASFAPEAWKVIRTRDVSGLSAGMYALTVAAFALWLGYGALQADWALIVPNALCLALAAFIFAMILMPKQKREDVAGTIERAVTPPEQWPQPERAEQPR